MAAEARAFPHSLPTYLRKGVAPSVLPKYLWAVKYHNVSCERVLKSAAIAVTISKS
jgi:hypothetical protein